MAKKSKFKIKKIVFIIFPILLFGFWFFASLLLNNKISFSVLEYPENTTSIKSAPIGQLVKGKKITGEFKANENNLGILILGFKDFVGHGIGGEDVLLFRIKEKGQKDWKYINAYRSGSLERKLEYPFGFPSIPDSKNKIYAFEIQSLYGTSKNAINLSHGKPSLTTAYQFPKAEIVGSKKNLVSFLFKKTLTSFTSLDFLISSLLYMIPLGLYLLIYFLFIRNLKKARNMFVCTTLLFMALDIVFLKEFYLGIPLGLSILWLVIVLKYKIESSVTFCIISVLVVMWILVIGLGSTDFQGKLNLWIFILLIISSIQLIWEERNKMTDSITYKNFVEKILTKNE